MAASRQFDLEDQEPGCTCTQTDVDLFDARGCELHDPNSWWNVALRAVTPVQVYETYEPVAAQKCPF
jgi:hypothetical protein